MDSTCFYNGTEGTGYLLTEQELGTSACPRAFSKGMRTYMSTGGSMRSGRRPTAIRIEVLYQEAVRAAYIDQRAGRLWRDARRTA